MEDKQALLALVELLNNHSFSVVEKEAVKHAIGVLSWTVLHSSVIKNMKEKRETGKQRRRN